MITKGPLKQAQLFTRAATFEPCDLPVVLDLETTGDLAILSLVQVIKACLAEIERISS